MKIAFVGAGGYGNVGDDTYPLVFKEHLPDCDLVFYNSDLPTELPHDLKMLVLGGGGLLYNSAMVPASAESDHFRAMKFYMDRAEAMGIPWGVSSCGFQFPTRCGPEHPETLVPWVPYLRRAEFLTLRSPACAEFARQIAGREDCRFFPDAAYLFRPQEMPPRGERTLVIVPAGAVNARDMFIQHFIRLFESEGFRQEWVSMGSHFDDDPLIADARRKYPHATIVEEPAPREALERIARAGFVMTGRYHGMIFARNGGVPFYVPQDSPHKIVHENYEADPARAVGHIEVLREAIASLAT